MSSSAPRSRSPHPSVAPTPPETWKPGRALVRRAVAPIDRFLQIEAASGILLIIAAAIALIWANSGAATSYQALWHTPLGLSLGEWSFSRDLHFWVNDGLMAIFFFVVGLEIRREIHEGELSTASRAALPVFAALGGVLLPAVIYASINWGHETIHGWAVPMATDIAFAVGILTLLGARVAPALRILLLALAVIDDVIAIVVIAVFYATDISQAGFVAASGGMVMMVLFKRLGVRNAWAYVAPGMVMWGGLYVGGVHPTLAGVIAGLLTPVTAWYGTAGFVAQAKASVDRLTAMHPPDIEVTAAVASARDALVGEELAALTVASREAISPVDRLTSALHGWVAYGIMPVFALANAGVPLGSATFDAAGSRVFWGIALGLAIGKPVGIMLLTRAMAATGVVALPRGVKWSHAAVVGMVAGVGFTMALFLAQLAFPPGPLLETAKLAVLCGSACAAVLGLIAGRLILPSALADGAAATSLEAETATDV